MYSVIIPCHNRLELLHKSLAGFLVQADLDDPFEIILVDNNSDENVWRLYKKYYQTLPLFLLAQPELKHAYSLCRARNMGMRLANYPWIVSLDSDCIVNPKYFSGLSRFLKEEGNYSCIIAGERIFVDARNFPVDALIENPGMLEMLPRVGSTSNYMQVRDRRMAELESLDTHPHPWALMHGGNLIFPLETALQVGGFDESYDGCWGYEDIEFAFRLINGAGATPVYLEHIYCYHQELQAITPKEHEIEYQRTMKADNRNWKKLIAAIPGFEQFKIKQYQSLGVLVQEQPA